MLKKGFALGILTVGLFLSVSTMAQARITDAAGDFLASYTGAQGGDLDVLSSEVTYDGTAFNITATLNGAIGTTPNAIYVWGFDRGQGTARFNTAPLNLSQVLFDSVVILRPDSTVSINRLVETGGTNLPAGSATINGNRISARINASELPSLGFSASNYTWNLWPRINGGTAANISDFAPNTTNAAVVTVPEASAGLLFAPVVGATAGMILLRRRNK